MKTQGLEGTIIECGVYEGDSAEYIQRWNAGHKPFFLIDSFEGLPQLSKQDNPHLFDKGDFPADYAQVQKRFQKDTNITIFKGWIPKIFQAVPETKYCFAHLDLDLYQPTFDALTYVFPRTVKNAIIMVHDVAQEGVNQALCDYFHISHEEASRVVDAYWVGRKI